LCCSTSKGQGNYYNELGGRNKGSIGTFFFFGRLHARIESGMTKIKTFIKGADWLCRYQLRGQIGCADINLIEGV